MVDNLGQAFEAGWQLNVRCERRRAGLKSVRSCPGTQTLDLGTILWTHGAACPIGYLHGRLRCPKCGTLDVLVLWSTPGSVTRQGTRAY